MIRRPPRSTLSSSSAASDVYKRQLNFIAGPLLIAGASTYVYKYDEPLDGAPAGYRLVALLSFLKIKAEVVDPSGTKTPSPTDMPECMVDHFKAAMAMTLIGGILALIVCLPLLAITVKFEKSILRFARAASLLVAAVFVVIALILAFTLPCQDDAFVQALLPKAKPHAGFILIILGLAFIVIAAVVAGVQAFFFAPKANSGGDASEANVEGGAVVYTTTPGAQKEKDAAGWNGTNKDEVTEGM
eukprot:TRINITY_DN7383_c0_g2_i1.p1 TRINITY_DN7383_c0_g2~~TRINITY_DN7383_c0_g2_i1.p1  ORF type:complete len:244 (-),score=87.40 TRINITY_DN7383_c0_g2_i1:408-1139(-)